MHDARSYRNSENLGWELQKGSKSTTANVESSTWRHQWRRKEGKGAEQEKRSKEIQWDSVTSSPFPYFFSMNLSPINRFKYFCCLIRTQPSCTAWCCACCSCWWSPVAWRSAWVGSWPSPRRLASPTSPAPPQPTDSHETRRSRSWPGKCVVDVPKLWTYFW